MYTYMYIHLYENYKVYTCICIYIRVCKEMTQLPSRSIILDSHGNSHQHAVNAYVGVAGFGVGVWHEGVGANEWVCQCV